ncbi:MAG: hypothetical protein R3352_05835 [Salinisphaeraceae bacterium]|nr:hypothetical protein [Salinisphaeraceae bacterium]
MKNQLRSIVTEQGIALLFDGKVIQGMEAIPRQAAEQIARTLLAQCRILENAEDPQKTIMDQAILHRAGFAVGLTDNGKMLSEAHKEAQWNTELRRYMKGAPGIKTSEIVGTPTIAGGKQA